MRILLADALDASASDALTAAGHEVETRADLTAGDLAGHLGGVDVLVVRSTKVHADAITAGADLSLIVRAGAGTDTIDVEAASAAGIHVCNVPGRNAVAVAELTMGLLLAIDRHIAAGTADLRSGVWNKKVYSKADGLLGRTIGIVGLGDIGLRVAERAKAFGLTVVGQRKNGRSEQTETAIRQIGIRLVDELSELAAASDIITVHVPSNDATRGLVDAEFLSYCRDGAIILNTSRGDVVDEAALIVAMDERGMRAGLDVFQNEPGSGNEFDSALAKHPSVVGTHHVGASTAQASRSVADGAVETIEAFEAGRPVNCVNLAPRGIGVWQVTVRHLDRVGVLASVLVALRGAGLNVSNMENRVFSGREAAVASIELSGSVPQETLDELAALDNVLGVSVVEIDG